ncbi:AMP-binding protein [Microbacterium sp. NC79]|uniref:AMP-binding protein n=1 Tax=Microbacterium sp. NC79 TaxID=2851009 RepID=UPI00349F4A38
MPAVRLYDFLFANLTPTDRERIALIDPSTGTEITFAELAANIDAFAGALAVRGVTTSTVIGLLCPNTTGFVTAFHGALRAGATVTTINATYTEREITSQLTDAGADWLLTISPLLPQAQAAADAAGIVS